MKSLKRNIRYLSLLVNPMVYPVSPEDSVSAFVYVSSRQWLFWQIIFVNPHVYFTPKYLITEFCENICMNCTMKYSIVLALVTFRIIVFCYRSVEPQYASTAGMFGGASLITGLFGGILFTLVMPLLVKTQVWDFL